MAAERSGDGPPDARNAIPAAGLPIGACGPRSIVERVAAVAASEGSMNGAEERYQAAELLKDVK
jgi:hypothetical protein